MARMAKDNGLKALQQRLRRVAAAIKRAADPALDQGAEEIVQMQKKLAPQDDGVLRDSIKWKKDGEYSRRITAGGKATTKRLRNSDKGNARDYDYAVGVEFGTAPHVAGGQFEGAHHPGTAPQPFFWPGYRLARKRAQKRIKRVVGKAIKDSWNGR